MTNHLMTQVPQTLTIGSSIIGEGHPTLLVAGPCAIPLGEQELRSHLTILYNLGIRHFRGCHVKPRSSSTSTFIGNGEPALKLMLTILAEFGDPEISFWTEITDYSEHAMLVQNKQQTGFSGTIVVWTGARTWSQSLWRLLGEQNDFVVMLKNGINDKTHTQMISERVSWVERQGQTAGILWRGTNGDCGDYRFAPRLEAIPDLKDSGHVVGLDPSHMGGNSPEHVMTLLREGLTHCPHYVLIETKHIAVPETDAAQAIPVSEFDEVVSILKNHNHAAQAA